MKNCKNKLHKYETHLKRCPECARASKAKYRAENVDKLKDRSAKYYANNADKLKANQVKYRAENPKKIKEYKSKPETKAKKAAYMKKYNSAPEVKAKILAYNKKYNSTPKYKAQKVTYQNNRRQSDPLFKLTNNIRSLIYKSFKNKGFSKSSQTFEILGIDFDTFLDLLIEKRQSHPDGFDPTIQYELDHIIPMSLVRTEEEILALNHYSNFQFLTKEENLIKSNKMFCSITKDELSYERKIEIMEQFIIKLIRQY